MPQETTCPICHGEPIRLDQWVRKCNSCGHIWAIDIHSDDTPHFQAGHS